MWMSFWLQRPPKALCLCRLIFPAPTSTSIASPTNSTLFCSTAGFRISSTASRFGRLAGRNDCAHRQREGKIYHGPLTLETAFVRIEQLYKPYHAALHDHAIDPRAVWLAFLLDCHSMPSQQSDRGSFPDFVLGDRFGTSCAPEITKLVQTLLRIRLSRRSEQALCWRLVYGALWQAPARHPCILDRSRPQPLYERGDIREVGRFFRPAVGYGAPDRHGRPGIASLDRRLQSGRGVAQSEQKKRAIQDD